MPTASTRVRRLDCRGEGLLVKVKLVRGSTKRTVESVPELTTSMEVSLSAGYPILSGSR